MAIARSIYPDEDFGPHHAVWELTMRCDHACGHCGSRAARARPDELETDELLEVARSLADLGCREVALIGGEAYLHPAFLTIVAYLAGRGVRVVLQTGGRGLTAELARACAQAGMAAVGVSIDGPEDVHDVIRGSKGSFRAGIRALENAAAAGMVVSSNTQVNRLTLGRLRETLEALLPTGIVAWRGILTVPMGRAADHPDWLLQPWEVIEAIDTLAALQVEVGTSVDVALGNNLGYFGPHEAILRTRPGSEMQWYAGCEAGRHTLGIESDGTIKGCPSLPTLEYAGGNVRELSLAEIWASAPQLAFARVDRTDELWGFCKTCRYAEICKGGCSFLTHCTLGRRGNNPFCYHRAAELKKRGRRERLIQKERAPGTPYDHGLFEIVEEDEP